MITSTLRGRLADRVVVAVAPILLGTGTDAVGDLDTSPVANGLRLRKQTVRQVGPDLVIAGTWTGPAAERPADAGGR